jgi:hypothetical protein
MFDGRNQGKGNKRSGFARGIFRGEERKESRARGLF